MLVLNFIPFPVLATKRLTLRQVTMQDLDEVYFLRSDPAILKYLDREPAQSSDDAAAFINNIIDLVTRNQAVTWAITLKENNKLIGTIGFWNITKEHFRAEIGYLLH